MALRISKLLIRLTVVTPFLRLNPGICAHRDKSVEFRLPTLALVRCNEAYMACAVDICRSRSLPMHTELIDYGHGRPRAAATRLSWHELAIGWVCLLVLLMSGRAMAAGTATPAECKALQAKSPQF